MHLDPHLIRPIDREIEINGPQGSVRLRLKDNRITANYTGRKLFNGSAQAYADESLNAALQTTEAFPLSWSYDSRGRQRITDLNKFYEQTFRVELQGIERLRYWTQQIAHP